MWNVGLKQQVLKWWKSAACIMYVEWRTKTAKYWNDRKVHWYRSCTRISGLNHSLSLFFFKASWVRTALQGMDVAETHTEYNSLDKIVIELCSYPQPAEMCTIAWPSNESYLPLSGLYVTSLQRRSWPWLICVHSGQQKQSRQECLICSLGTLHVRATLLNA